MVRIAYVGQGLRKALGEPRHIMTAPSVEPAPALFEKLDVWQLAHQLVLEIYDLTSRFPSSERFGIIAQMRRAALAVPTNIVEGNARRYVGEYLQFCNIARGSVAELKYLLRVGRDLTLLSAEQYETVYRQYDRLGAMLQALINGLRAREGRQHRPIP